MDAEGKVKMAYELCIAPGEEHSGSMPKAFLLTNSAIGSTHWLTPSSSQVTLLLQDVQDTEQSMPVLNISFRLPSCMHEFIKYRLCFCRGHSSVQRALVYVSERATTAPYQLVCRRKEGNAAFSKGIA